MDDINKKYNSASSISITGRGDNKVTVNGEQPQT